MNNTEFHESIERQSSIDYYNKMRHICSDIYEKYHHANNLNNYHVCAYINKSSGKFICGENSIKKQPGCPISTHAEIMALHKVLKDTRAKKLDRYDILVIRISKTGKLGSSRPCYHCINTMLNNQHVKIKYVYYSTNDGRIMREELKTMRDSPLTCVSTGWRARTNKKKKQSGYSSDESSSDSSGNGISSRDSMIQVFDAITGERKLVYEREHQQKFNKY